MVEPIVSGEKSCYKCWKVKPYSEFYIDRHHRWQDGHYKFCKACVCAAAKAVYDKRAANHPILSFSGAKFCPKCKIDKPKKTGFARSPGSPDRLASWCKTCMVKSSRRAKYDALLHYSGPGAESPFCACCGESKFEFLTLDHINGGGGAHRKQTRKYGSAYCLMLRRQGFPEGCQTLCMNCNCAKQWYGHCPHTCTHPEH